MRRLGSSAIDTASIETLVEAVTLLSFVLIFAGCVWCCRWVSCEHNRADEDQRERIPDSESQGGLLQAWNRSFPDLEDWDELKIGSILNARRKAEVRAVLYQLQQQWNPAHRQHSEQAELEALEVRGLKRRLSVGDDDFVGDPAPPSLLMVSSPEPQQPPHHFQPSSPAGLRSPGAAAQLSRAAVASRASPASPASLEEAAVAGSGDEWDL